MFFIFFLQYFKLFCTIEVPAKDFDKFYIVRQICQKWYYTFVQ